MRTSSKVSWKNMTSNDTDDVIRGEVDDLTRNAKTTMNIQRFLQRKQKTHILV